MADWFRQLARLLRTARIYQANNPVLVQAREELYGSLLAGLRQYGAWHLQFGVAEIRLEDQPVVVPRPNAEGVSRPDEHLAFHFYRDGIRSLSLLPGLPQRDLDALVDGLLQTWHEQATGDDLVTLLWLANPTHLIVESVPVEQFFYLSSEPPSDNPQTERAQGQVNAESPAGGDLRADIGQARAQGPTGLHVDRLDDWALPESSGGVEDLYPELAQQGQAARERLMERWAAERDEPLTVQAPRFFAQIRATQPSTKLRSALAHATMTWFVSVIQRGEWREARLVLRILRDLDPDRSLTDAPLAENLRGLDAIALTERLDESTSEEQAEFLGLSGALGQPALHLVCEVMAHASRTRTRAAACTLLSYLCSDDPRLLAPYLDDSRPQVVRNTVFVLGQIGGPDVAPLLARAAHHPDGQVRRQVIHSLAAVPRDEHVPILLAQLGTRDPQLLAATLNLLARQPDAQVARAIAHYVQAPDFESRSEESQLSLLNALAETAGDEAVPVLQGVLLKGGWFAQRSFARTAAARCLGRLSTPAARAVLEAARHSRSEAVRRAAHEADRREAAA